MSRTTPASASAPAATEGPADLAPPGVTLEEHLPASRPERDAAPPIAAGGMRVATALRRERREVMLRLRGRGEELRVALAPEVEVEVIDDAIAGGDAVLVEVVAGEPPAVIGVLTRRRARATVVRGTTVTVDADEEVVLRAGRSALRLRADGDVELVGSRISATSRGLFRLVGRLLRLN